MGKRALAISLLLLVVLAMILASCATSSKVTVQPLSNVPQGVDGPHVRDIGANSVRIVFTSGVPVVCNVAYGKDDSYGNLAVMPMAGVVTQHELNLTGLEPETTYHFKTTVTDLSGNLYQSDDRTFTTAKGEVTAKPAGRNVAAASERARVVGVSSNWGGGDLDSSFGGNRAIDGNRGTEWSSNGDGNSAWIEIELSQSFDLTALGFWTRTMGSSAQVSSFSVVTDSGQRLGPFDVPDASAIHYFDVKVKARRLRFEVETSSGGNTGSVEIEAYAVQ
ncbi:MAG: discoidin domain-containing protein [Chloroflexi bacterium]|nr:discoidin domain-containing protein [Chloroflexota bacterium]